MNAVLRELRWVFLSGFLLLAFIGTILGLHLEASWPRLSEAGGMFVSLFLMITLIRVFIWAAKGGARAYKHWPEVAILVGACALAYGAAARLEQVDRYVVTIGTGLILIGAFFWARLT